MWLCLTAMYFFLLRADEMFASDKGVVHPVHCLTRGQIAFRRGDRQLEYMDWSEAESVEVLYRGHKADKLQEGTVRERTKDEVYGPRSGYGTGGGAVALMVELMSRHPTLPDHAPLSSYRDGRYVKVFRRKEGHEVFERGSGEFGTRPETLRVALATDRGDVCLGSGGRDIRSGSAVDGKMEVWSIQGICGRQLGGLEECLTRTRG